MQAGGKLRRQDFMDGPRPGDPAHALETLAHEKNCKMRFPLWPGAGMAGMSCAVIDNANQRGREGTAEFGSQTRCPVAWG